MFLAVPEFGVPRAEEGFHGIADRREFVLQSPLRLELAGTEGNLVSAASFGGLDFGDDRVFDVLGGHGWDCGIFSVIQLSIARGSENPTMSRCHFDTFRSIQNPDFLR